MELKKNKKIDRKEKQHQWEKPQKLFNLEPNRIFRGKLLLNLNLSTFCIPYQTEMQSIRWSEIKEEEKVEHKFGILCTPYGLHIVCNCQLKLYKMAVMFLYLQKPLNTIANTHTHTHTQLNSILRHLFSGK